MILTKKIRGLLFIVFVATILLCFGFSVLSRESWKSGDTTVTLSRDGTLKIGGRGAMDDYYSFIVIRSDGDAPGWRKIGYRVTRVVIGRGVTYVGKYAFRGCEIMSISVASGNPNYSSEDGVLFNKDKTKLILYPKSKNCLTYTIPNGVTSIEDNAFDNCRYLEKLTIPGSMKVIVPYAFSWCENLTTVIISSGVTSIERSAFSSCEKLTSITIPNSVVSIGEGFASGSRISSITIPESVTAIGRNFHWMSLSSITVLNPIPPASGLDGLDKDVRYESGAFSPMSEYACLYVPESSIAAYRMADNWREFKCIEAISTEGNTNYSYVDGQCVFASSDTRKSDTV